jgi:short-subunit dehydrogenase
MAETKTAIVVGGTAGIGRAVVESLLERGFRVGVMARGEDRLQALAAAHPGRVETVQADAGLASKLDVATDTIVGALGVPSIWVNAAMLTSFSPFDRMEVDEFEAIVRTTFLGQVNGTRAALRVMNRGQIVNIGSGLGYRPVPFQSAYCAAKHAINGFTSSVRSELLRSKRPIDISLVQLPAVNTPQFEWARNRLEKMPQPAPPIFQPEVAAKAVMQAIDDGIREIFVGKSVLQLVFGDMVLPAFIDSMLARQGAEMQKSEKDEPGERPDNIMGPVAREGTAHGRFDDRAYDSGVIVDADQIRKLAFFGVPTLLVIVAFVLGLLVG